jgi:hypothetical protein
LFAKSVKGRVGAEKERFKNIPEYWHELAKNYENILKEK